MSLRAPGTEIDGFCLGETVHVGGMAWIHRLVGPKGPLPLVMKIPRLAASQPAANVISFEVERMVLGSLTQSAHAPTLVAYGELEATPYLVMEYVEGTRLTEWLGRTPLPAKEIARLGAALALALYDLHRQDVAHLDVKPGNVLYRASGTAVLIDFGLSHHAHFPDLLAEGLSFPVGNWPYMSPEQVLGVRCDPRSDIFALGAILYQLATGRLPFGSPDSIADLRRRLYREPLPPRAIVPETPEWLQEVILHCLEVDARARYASSADIAFDLANYARIVPGERGLRSRPPGWTTQLRRWAQARHFEPAPCPPPSTPAGGSRLVVMALAPEVKEDALLDEAMRAAAHAIAMADPRCRIACVTVVPPAASLSGEGAESSAAARHLKRLVELRAWAKPLDLPEERVTCHVLEGDKPAETLIEYAALNDAVQILIGAPASRTARRSSEECARIVDAAPCTVTVIRPPAAS